MNKKELILLAASMFVAAGCYGQGTVVFANTSTTLITTNNGGNVGLTSGLNAYRFGLYIAPQGRTAFDSFTLVGTATNQSGIGNGRFNGGNPFEIPGNTGQTIAFQIRAWSFFAGSSFEAAQTYAGSGGIVITGWSSIGEVTPSTGTATTAALFGTGAGQVGGFVITPVPEPASIALGLLGLGAVALFRRASNR